MKRETILVLCLVLATVVSPAFCMQVPSEGAAPHSAPAHAQGGGKQLTDQELILIVTGAVCGTLILLAVLK